MLTFISFQREERRKSKWVFRGPSRVDVQLENGQKGGVSMMGKGVVWWLLAKLLVNANGQGKGKLDDE